ncbi:MAG: hypothetical protein SGCHY_004866, partial [Lobulomycetales sp.]
MRKVKLGISIIVYTGIWLFAAGVYNQQSWDTHSFGRGNRRDFLVTNLVKSDGAGEEKLLSIEFLARLSREMYSETFDAITEICGNQKSRHITLSAGFDGEYFRFSKTSLVKLLSS